MIAILICLFIVTTGAKRSSNKIKWLDSNENTQMQNIFVILPLKHLSIIFLLSQYKEILSPSYLAHVLNTFCFFFLYAKIFIALTMESVITWKKNYKVAHLAWMIFFSVHLSQTTTLRIHVAQTIGILNACRKRPTEFGSINS